LQSTDHFREWQLDELGNWRGHKEAEADSFLTPGIDDVNAYTSWKFKDAAGALQALAWEYDNVRGFLYQRAERTGSPLIYVHDPLGRLVEVGQDTNGDDIADVTLTRYGYSTTGLLGWREEHMSPTVVETVKYIYTGGKVAQEVRIEEGGGSTVLWEYAWSGSRLIRSTEIISGARRHYHIHQDRLGSVVAETAKHDGDSETKIKGRNHFDPYGRRVVLPLAGGSAPLTPYGFTGSRIDDAAMPDVDLNDDGIVDQRALLLMHHRWYDPEIGRFLQQDPIGETGGLDLYAYVGASPTMWVDPTGLSKLSGRQQIRAAGMAQRASFNSAGPGGLVGRGPEDVSSKSMALVGSSGWATPSSALPYVGCIGMDGKPASWLGGTADSFGAQILTAALEQGTARAAKGPGESTRDLDSLACASKNGAIAIVASDNDVDPALASAKASGKPIGVFINGVGNDRESVERAATETARVRGMFVIGVVDSTALGEVSLISTVIDLVAVPIMAAGGGNIDIFGSKVRAFPSIDRLKTILSDLDRYSENNGTNVTLIAHSRGGIIADIVGNEHGEFEHINLETYGSAHYGGVGDGNRASQVV